MNRYRALDGWRGVCALGVSLNHAWFLGHYRSWSIVNNFHLFVDYFFVLSGLVICTAYANRLTTFRDIAPYMIRRFGRLYPLHVVTLFVFVAYEVAQVVLTHRAAGVVFSGAQSPKYIVANLLLLQGMGIDQQSSWNGPSWSISVEFFLYVLVALVLVLTPRRAFPAIAAALSVVGAVVLYRFAPRLMDSTYDFGFARGVYGFFMGCIVFRLLQARRPIEGARFGTAIEVLALAAVGLFMATVGRGSMSMLSSPLFAWLVWLFAQESGAISRGLKRAVGQALGRWSYSIYLWHYPLLFFIIGGLKLAQSRFHHEVIRTVTRPGDGQSFTAVDLGSVWLNDLAAISFVALVVGVAAASHRLVEKPGIAFSKRIARPLERRNERVAREGSTGAGVAMTRP